MYSLHFILLQINQIRPTDIVIIAGVWISVLTILMISMIVFHRHRRNRLVLEREIMREQFDRQLMFSKIEVQEETFDLVSKEIHDNVGQLLSTAKMLIGVTERKLESPPPSLVSANKTLNLAIEELRNLSRSLNKEWLQQFDLYDNIEEEVERINSGGIVNVSFVRDAPVRLVSERQFMLFRIIQEGLNNVLRHASASHSEITISHHNKGIVAAIKDDGTGFDPATSHSGIGINNMVERVKSLGGKINWKSGLSGTIVSIHLPINF